MRKKRRLGKLLKRVGSSICSLAIMLNAVPPVRFASAQETADPVEDVSLEDMILGDENAVLQRYSSEDIAATESFLLNGDYNGYGKVIDANDDDYVDSADLCVMRRDHSVTGNYCELLHKLIEESESGDEVSTSAGDIYSNRVIVRTDCAYDFSKYDTVAILSNSENKYILQFDSPEKTESCQRELDGKPHIIYAEIDKYFVFPEAYGDMTVDDDGIETDWGAKAIEAQKLSDFISDCYNNFVTVAVIDSGVDEHSMLRSRLVNKGYDIVKDSKDATHDRLGHGTHVAGIIAQCTPEKNVGILPINVFDGKKCWSESVASGIEFARKMNVDVINISLTVKDISPNIDYEIGQAVDAGITVVVAAGNYANDVEVYSPAHLEEAIVVTAVDRDLKHARFSNFGKTVDLCAPGVDIYSCLPNERYDKDSGTSMSAAHISAAAAMIKCIDTSASPSDVEERLAEVCSDLGDKGYDEYYGHGLPKLGRLITEDILPSVSVSAGSIQLFTGDKYQLSASVTPADAELTWTSSNPDAVTVSDGVITAVNTGKAVITAGFKLKGNEYSASCEVNVKSPMIRLNETEINLFKGGTYKLTAETLPIGRLVKWESSNGDVAVVNNGKVTAIGAGTATISALMNYNGYTLFAQCIVNVEPVGIVFKESTKHLYRTDMYNIEYDMNPPGKSIIWSSSNTDAARVEDGRVIAINPGTSVITGVYAFNNELYSANCIVEIEDPSCKLDKTDSTIYMGGACILKPENVPEGTTVKWTSSDPDIAEVKNGVVTPKSPGNVKIEASFVYNYITYKDSCIITVKNYSVELSETSKTLLPDEKFTLRAETNPPYRALTWTSSDESVATVKNGVVTALEPGRTVITAQFINNTTGEKYFDTCNVTVGYLAFNIDQTSKTLSEGDSFTLITSGAPKDADILWSTSGRAVASVEDGVVTANGQGTAVITASFRYDGRIYTATCKVTVVKPSIYLTQSDTVIYKTDQLVIAPIVSPVDAEVTWTTSDPDVLTVENGLVTAVGAGSALITASININGVKSSAQCKIGVNDVGVFFDKDNGDFYVGEVYPFPLRVSPGTSGYTMKLSNTAAASFTNGGFKAKSEGKVKFTASMKYNDIEYTDSMEYDIKTPTISLDQSSITINVGEEHILKAESTPDTSIPIWRTGNSSILSVSDGVITGLLPGVTYVEAYFTRGDEVYSAICTVTVKESILKLDKKSEMMLPNSKTVLSLVSSDYGSEVTWSSSDESIATVDNGVVTSHKTGIAYITASIKYEGILQTARCAVQVANRMVKDTSVFDLREFTVNVKEGSNAELTIDKMPKNSVVRWLSSDEDVCTVTSDGIITGKGSGQCVITAYTLYDNEIYADECVVTVT